MSQVHSLSKCGGGREIDSHGKRAGKGALIQTEMSGTIGVSQDQSLFQNVPIASGEFLNPPVAGTLDANYYKGLGERNGVERTNVVGFEFQTVAIEGNGTRESHHGDGYAVTDTMFTLNSTEQHAVAAQNNMPNEAYESDCIGTSSERFSDKNRG